MNEIKHTLLRRAGLLLLAASLAWTGCDSSEEDLSDLELFVGTWQAVSATASGLGGVDLLTLLQADLTITLTETDYSIQLEVRTDPDAGVDAGGSGYAVNDNARTITFPAGEQIASDVVMQYAFSNDGDRVTLTFDGAVLALLGLEIPGGGSLDGQTITLVVERLS